MSTETLPADGLLELYNPYYVTRFGLKDVEINGKPAVVHDTSNLPHLFDAYFRAQKGSEPPNRQAEISTTMLREEVIQSVLDDFIQGYPELAGLLKGISQKRDMEYERRAEIRNKGNIFRSRDQNFAPAFPTQAEHWRRDFVYSVALDHIGDMTYGRDFDLGDLCE